MIVSSSAYDEKSSAVPREATAGPMSTFDWYKHLVFPVLRQFRDPETASAIANVALQLTSPLFRQSASPDPRLQQTVFGKVFLTPIGSGAGLDKYAKLMHAHFDIGFGFVEVGTITPLAQHGNPRRRVVRLDEDFGIINRMGFPSEGLEAAVRRFEARRPPGIVGINIGANKESADRVQDYVACATALARFADYLVCNVSSPNTPGLRELQGPLALAKLLEGVVSAVRPNSVPILVKIAPDLEEHEIHDVVNICKENGIAGMIVGNTTLSRPTGLLSPNSTEQGGLSGEPLFERSTSLLRKVAIASRGQLPLIGCGGVSTGAHAYAKIRAGASLVQMHTALIYEGPMVIRRVEKELLSLLELDGHESVADAVGSDLM